MNSGVPLVIVLAQLADIFEPWQWRIILGLGVFFLFSPVLGFLIGWARGGTRFLKRAWWQVLSFYALVFGLVGLDLFIRYNLNPSYPCVLLLIGCVVLMCGPMLGGLFALSAPGPRYSVGHCQKCGYDLRASRQQCPECGEPITPR